jgi:hypothetical protein
MAGYNSHPQHSPASPDDNAMIKSIIMIAAVPVEE